MKTRGLFKLLIVTIVAFGFIGCNATKAPAQPSFEKSASQEVKKLIKEHNLEVVGYDHVLKAIGDGTRTNAKALIIDARPFKKYKIAHIPSSRALPDTKFDKLYDILYGSIDKNKEIIVYCGGYKCIKSPKVALKFIAKGHKNVKVYIAGLPEWKKKNYVEIDTIVAKAIFDKQGGALFVDARPWGKFVGSTITGSISVPDTKFDKFVKFMPIDKSAAIITYCGGYKCHKSHSVAKKLVDLGYTNVKVFAAGFPAWKKKKYPYTGGKKAKFKKKKANVKSKSGVLMQGADTGTVDGEWFIKNYKKLPKSVTLIDVRAAEDFAKGTISGAINMQTEKMKPEAIAKAIPQSGDVIFFCGTGTRAMEARGFLQEIKYKRLDNVFYFDAQIECDKNNKCKMVANEPVGI